MPYMMRAVAGSSMLYICGATRTIFFAVSSGASVDRENFLLLFMTEEGNLHTATAMRFYIVLLEIALPDFGEVPDLAPFR